MPRRKTWRVESLVEKCLQSIAKELANISPDNFVAKTLRESSSRVFPPFDEWPLQLLEQVVEFLGMHKSLDVRHHYLLMNKQTRKLNLSPVAGISVNRAAAKFMKLASRRCPDISDLLLSGVTVSPQQFNNYLPLFTQLQVLDVAWTKFNNAGLHILGAHCSNLRELDVSKCPVSDDGIEGLCGGQSGLSTSIEKLSMADTKVTQKGVETALRRLPRLKILVHPLVMETLADMAQNDHSIQGRKFGLLQLDFDVIEDDPWLVVHDYSKPYKTGVLNAAAFFCPFVTHLNIGEIKGLADSDFLGLLALENLQNLKISSYPYDTDCIFTFDGALAPLLKARGRSLKCLKLEGLAISVRLGVVVKYCPNLKVLSLDCDYSTSFWPEEDQQQAACKPTKMDFVFKHLEKLTFSGEICREPPPLGELLSAAPPTLKTLVIHRCSDFDDQLLLQVFELFKALEKLESHFCRLTKGGIERVLFNEENCLKIFKMSVFRRDSVPFEDLGRKWNTYNWADLHIEVRIQSFRTVTEEDQFD